MYELEKERLELEKKRLKLEKEKTDHSLGDIRPRSLKDCNSVEQAISETDEKMSSDEITDEEYNELESYKYHLEQRLKQMEAEDRC